LDYHLRKAKRFGINEKSDYEIVGVYDAQDLQQRVAEQCKQMQPVVRQLFTVTSIKGKTIVSAEIPGVDTSERPVYYKGVGRVKGLPIRTLMSGTGNPLHPFSQIN